MSRFKRICVFCGSSVGSRPAYAAAARELGRTLAERGLGVVFGGGKVGLMGVLADAALAAGGEAIGVIPEALVAREIGHNGLTKLHVVRSMHQRKTLMADLADAFIALPGGYGTFEEFFEAVTWTQLGMHQKPCGLLNVDGYYDALLALLGRAVADGFIREANRALVLDAPDVPTLLQKLEALPQPSSGSAKPSDKQSCTSKSEVEDVQVEDALSALGNRASISECPVPNLGLRA